MGRLTEAQADCFSAFTPPAKRYSKENLTFRFRKKEKTDEEAHRQPQPAKSPEPKERGRTLLICSRGEEEMDVVKTAQLSGRTLERVVVHPLVLLSIVDHYNRVARKRVVGVLLGTSSRGSVDVTNSYAGKGPRLCPPLGYVAAFRRGCVSAVPRVPWSCAV
jgi:hypothetical protein